MRNNLLKAVCLWATSFAPGIGTASVATAERLTGTENPDPSHIKGASGNTTLTLTPRNDIEDHRNLQWAFDNAAPGGTVRLGAGTFFMGDGKAAPRKTAWMRRGLKVVGVKEGAIWRTVIRGGGEVLEPGVGGALEGGTFRIKLEDDDHAVILEDLWFRQWSCIGDPYNGAVYTPRARATARFAGRGARHWRVASSWKRPGSGRALDIGFRVQATKASDPVSKLTSLRRITLNEVLTDSSRRSRVAPMTDRPTGSGPAWEAHPFGPTGSNSSSRSSSN